MNPKPDFFIIGGMKCATSTLHQQLAHQPDFFMTELKEPNFFSNDEIYEKGMDWYLSLFADAQSTDMCGESSTHYTKLPTYPNTIPRLREAFPEAKLIYIMRHPIDRLVSQYIHEWSQLVINQTTIDAAIYDFPELVDYSKYAYQLSPYLEAFSRDKILPVFFERMLHSPQLELERVARFLGKPATVHWVTDLDAQNVSNQRLRQSAWRDFLVELAPLKYLRQKLIPKSFRTWVRGFWAMKEKPQLSEISVKYLEAQFDPDLKILGDWLGVTDFNCQTFKSVVKSQSLEWHS